MTRILIVGIGGFLGSVLRYLLGGWVQEAAGSRLFPFGTLAVNAAGCLVIGLVGGLAGGGTYFRPEFRLFLLIGVLGGFTTFCTFGYETAAFLMDGQLVSALANIAAQLVIGLGAVFLGFRLARMI